MDSTLRPRRLGVEVFVSRTVLAAALVAALCAPLMDHEAQAQSPGAAPAAPAAKWQVDWGEFRCSLLREMGGDAPITLALRIVPGTDSPELMLVSKSWKSNPLSRAGDVSVILPGAGAPIAASAVSQQLPGAGRAVMVGGLPADMLDRFAKANGLIVSRKDKVIATLSFTGAGKAVAALRECNNGLLRSWGVDPEADKLLTSRAHWTPPPRSGPVVDVAHCRTAAFGGGEPALAW